MIQELFATLTPFGSYLNEPDRRFYRFNLAEKGANALKGMVSPML